MIDVDKLKNLGFYNNILGWRFSKDILHDIFFTVQLDEEGKLLDTLTYDTYTGQPYHYGHSQTAKECVDKIDAILDKFKNAGLEVEYDHEEYCVGADTTLTGGQSNGRTGDSGSPGGGSIPSLPT